MCEVATIAAVATVISVAVTTASAVQQQAAASAHAKAEAESIRQQTTDEYKQVDNQQTIVQNQAYQKQNAEAIAAREAAATSETGAGEAGVGGNSVAALARSYFNREGNYDESVNVNRDADVARLQLQQQGFQDQGQSALNQIQQPSWLSTGAKIAGAVADGGFQAYSRYESLKLPTNPTKGTA